MTWWGEPWPSVVRRAEVCADDRFREPVPVGQRCLWCNEVIKPVDRGIMVGTSQLINGERTTSIGPEHMECTIRGTVGSVAQLEGREAGRAPGISCREDAMETYWWVLAHRWVSTSV